MISSLEHRFASGDSIPKFASMSDDRRRGIFLFRSSDLRRLPYTPPFPNEERIVRDRVTWTITEDAALIELINRYGPHWPLVATALNAIPLFRGRLRTRHDCWQRATILHQRLFFRDFAFDETMDQSVGAIFLEEPEDRTRRTRRRQWIPFSPFQVTDCNYRLSSNRFIEPASVSISESIKQIRAHRDRFSETQFKLVEKSHPQLQSSDRSTKLTSIFEIDVKHIPQHLQAMAASVKRSTGGLPVLPSQILRQ